jgi:hypothetical protein
MQKASAANAGVTALVAIVSADNHYPLVYQYVQTQLKIQDVASWAGASMALVVSHLRGIRFERRDSLGTVEN